MSNGGFTEVAATYFRNVGKTYSGKEDATLVGVLRIKSTKPCSEYQDIYKSLYK